MHAGIVTRCPLELKMKRSREEDFWQGKIKYKKDHNQDYEEEIEDPADVEKKIREGSDSPESTFSLIDRSSNIG